MRLFRTITTVAVMTATMQLTLASPASAGITQASFSCEPNLVRTQAPDYRFESSITRVWWIPEYFRWDGQAWQSVAYGDWHYQDTSSGSTAPHMWHRYPSAEPSGSDSYPAGGAYYAVRSWVYAEGGWHAAWSVNSGGPGQPAPQSDYWCLT